MQVYIRPFYVIIKHVTHTQPLNTTLIEAIIINTCCSHLNTQPRQGCTCAALPYHTVRGGGCNKLFGDSRVEERECGHAFYICYRGELCRHGTEGDREVAGQDLRDRGAVLEEKEGAKEAEGRGDVDTLISIVPGHLVEEGDAVYKDGQVVQAARALEATIAVLLEEPENFEDRNEGFAQCIEVAGTVHGRVEYGRLEIFVCPDYLS